MRVFFVKYKLRLLGLPKKSNEYPTL
jgi:hypothetical protein